MQEALTQSSAASSSVGKGSPAAECLGEGSRNNMSCKVIVTCHFCLRSGSRWRLFLEHSAPGTASVARAGAVTNICGMELGQRDPAQQSQALHGFPCWGWFWSLFPVFGHRQSTGGSQIPKGHRDSCEPGCAHTPDPSLPSLAGFEAAHKGI